ncbi:MAG: hypothetical protein QOF85_2567 [Solirubrobacterales bacterium]|nr:hypothetical protein [Solirubrobacterales bacterium]
MRRVRWDLIYVHSQGEAREYGQRRGDLDPRTDPYAANALAGLVPDIDLEEVRREEREAELEAEERKFSLQRAAAQAWMAQPSTARAASRIASEIVGWGWTICASSW